MKELKLNFPIPKKLNTGLLSTIEDILEYVNKNKNPYLTVLEMANNRWVVGASHCTIRELIRSNKLPGVKVGNTYKSRFDDLIEHLIKSYKRQSL